MPNFLIINKICISKKESEIYRREYNNSNQDQIVNAVQTVNWDELLLDCNNVDVIFDHIYTKVTQVIDEHAPLKKLSRKEAKFNLKPWITAALKVSIRKKMYFLKNTKEIIPHLIV